MKKKIISVVGARPNFIKLAALHPFLNKDFNHIIIHTGQHYDFELSKSFFDELKIPKPKYNLGVGSATYGEQTGKIIERCEKVLIDEKPDLVIVYGDTNSTLASALSASKLNIPVAHVEAGMRSHDRSMPEEINRVITDHLSSLLFCPSAFAVKCLSKEGIIKNVYNTGDVMYDIFLKIKPNHLVLKRFNLKPKSYYFATVHRQENTDNLQRLRQIFNIFESLDRPVILPIHPRTRKALSRIKINLKNTKLLEPVKFSDNIALEQNSSVILTDSGGIQKEAYWLKIPCLTLRNSSEWPETVESGWNHIMDLDSELILKYMIQRVKQSKTHLQYYGKGDSAKKIINVIKKWL